MRASRGLLAPCLAAAVLAACTVREPRPEGAWLDDRLDWFRARQQWTVNGRLGLSDGERGGSLAMTWRADGPRHTIFLRTVAGGRQWRLEIAPEGSTLVGSDVGRLHGPDPDALVERAVGWPIPVRWMSEWLRGLPAPARARTGYATDGTLERLEWQDWTLEYRRWTRLDESGVLLPSRVEATNPPYRVRAALRDWRFDGPAGPGGRPMSGADSL